MYVSLDGDLRFNMLSFAPEYCNTGAYGDICYFLYINDTATHVSTCSQINLYRNRLSCLNCMSYEYDYTVNMLPKLILPDQSSVALSQERVDSIWAFYNTLTTDQINNNNLSMSLNFISFMQTLVKPKSAYFQQEWIWPGGSSSGYASYGSFERLIAYSGYYQDWGLSATQMTDAKFVIDYNLNFDLHDSIDLTATSAPFKFRYLFYSDVNAKGPCETEVTSNFLNTFKIDSVRVQDGYFNPAVNFDSLFLVIAPGIRIPVKSDFQNTLAAHSPDARAQIDVWPNPASDFVRIQSQGNAIESLSLFDSWGRVLRTLSGNTTYNYQLDLRDLPAGMYFVRVESAGKHTVRKILKR